MTYADPDRSLTLPTRPNDVFDANYHPDLDTLIELRFQAFKTSGLGSKIRDSETRADANTMLGKILVGLVFGVPILSFAAYQFAMMVST